MDDRTTQIKEGAGLEESRINREFVELLQKWSSPVLLIMALIVGAYAGNNWLKQRQNSAVNEAFGRHVEITETASPAPASLRAVAAQYGDIRGVGTLAQLRLADVLVQSVLTGAKPGATLELDENNQPTGTLAEVDRMTDADREQALDEARTLYQDVLDGVGDALGEQIHAVRAAFGLASVAETRGDAAAARAAYQRAIEAAEKGELVVYRELAEARLATVDRALTPRTLYTRDELPEIPEPEPVEPVLPAESDTPADDAAQGTAEPGTDEAPASDATEPASDEAGDEDGAEAPGGG